MPEVGDRVRHRRTRWSGTVTEVVGELCRVRWDLTGNTGLPLRGDLLERIH
jgi:hypothetical protein